MYAPRREDEEEEEGEVPAEEDAPDREWTKVSPLQRAPRCLSGRSASRRTPPGPGRLVSCALLWLLVASCALAAGTDETSQQLKQADAIKLRDYPRFAQILHSLQEREPQLAPAHREYLDYLQGWNSVYTGNYAEGHHAAEPSRRQGCRSDGAVSRHHTIVNVLTLSQTLRGSFARLNRSAGDASQGHRR